MPHSHQLNMLNQTRGVNKNENITGKLEHKLLHKIQMKFFLSLLYFCPNESKVSSFYEENKFKPCLTC